MRVVPTLAAVVMLGACGRIGFDPQATRDAARGDGATDGVTGDTASNGLLLSFQFEADGLLKNHGSGPNATCTGCPMSTPGVHAGTTGARFGGNQCLVIGSADLSPPVVTFALWTKQPVLQTATMFGKPFNGATLVSDSLEVYTMSSSSSIIVVAGDATVQMSSTIGAWHHIAVTFDGSTLTGYVDGVVTNTKTGLVPTPYAGDPFRIGCDHNSGIVDNYFTGDLDEVRLYDRVLSKAELQQLATP